MPKEDRLKISNKIVILLLFLLCSFIFLKISFFMDIHIDCPTYKWTGYYCPVCGLSRMILALFEGHFYQAFRWNPFIFTTLVVILSYFLFSLITKKTLEKRIILSFLIIYILLFISFGVMRNIELFSFFAPVNV